MGKQEEYDDDLQAILAHKGFSKGKSLAVGTQQGRKHCFMYTRADETIKPDDDIPENIRGIHLEDEEEEEKNLEDAKKDTGIVLRGGGRKTNKKIYVGVENYLKA